MKLTLQWFGVLLLIATCICLILIQVDIHMFTGVEEFLSSESGFIERKTGLFSLGEVFTNDAVYFDGPSFLFLTVLFLLIPLFISYSVFSHRIVNLLSYRFSTSKAVQTREIESLASYSFTHPRRGEFAYAKFSRSTNYK